jgi:hypothetical protein
MVRPLVQHGLLNQSSAQVIDGSLKFDKSQQHYLTRTPSGSGNRDNWTISCWLKRGKFAEDQRFFESGNTAIRFGGVDNFQWIEGSGGNNGENTPSARIRDTEWYHCVFHWDSGSGATAGNRIFINGRELPYNQTGSGNPNTTSAWNTGSQVHTIGANSGNSGRYYDGQMAQVYFIDGLSLGPEYFGFTDPLTGTWRPKKFKNSGTTVNDGTNWSGNFSGSHDNNHGWDDLYEGANAFDGSLTSYAIGQASSTGLTWTAPGGGIGADAETIRIYGLDDACPDDYLKINGKNYGHLIPQGFSQQWAVLKGPGAIDGGIHQLESIYVRDNASGNAHYRWGALEIDGVILVDNTTQNLDFGTNGFYLPMDGNSPIGEDKSGKNNDWTPVNFGGFNAPDKATGALPILDGSGLVASTATRTDSNASSVVLALPLAGNANDLSNQINSSSTTKAVTVDGPTASTAQSNFYSGSMLFDGSNDELNVAASGELDFGANDDWTFELWFYSTTVSSSWAISDYSGNNSGTGSPGGQIYFSSSSGAGLHWYQDSTRLAEIPKEQIKANQWHHVAFVKDGTANTITSFLDGVQRASSSFNGSSGSTANGLNIGQQGGGTFFSGHMSDFRVYKGVKKYTSDFVPASADPDIRPETPSGVSGSSKLTEITGGAVAFDGSSDYLIAGDSSDLAVGDGDFTLECFVYRDSSVSAFGNFIATRGSSGSSTGYTFGAQASSNGYDVEFYTNAMSGIDGGDQKITPNRWHHVVLTRSGSTLRSFVNGVLNTTATNSQDFSNSSMYIGITNDGSQGPHNGLISNVRVIKGSIPTDYQTSSTTVNTRIFNPPTETLTTTSQGATANDVKLLCCQSNTQPGSATKGPNVSGSINTGVQWSSYGENKRINSSYPWTKAFDGTTDGSFSNGAGAADGEGWARWAPGVTITISSQLRINTDNGTTSAVKVKISGSNEQHLTSLSDGWNNVSGTGTLEYIDIYNSGSTWSYLCGVEVDGTVLRDPLTKNADANATTFNPFISDINSVRGQESVYCTLNPHDGYVGVKDGRLETVTSSGWQSIRATMGMNSGKFYWETQNISNDGTILGIADSNASGFVDGAIFGSTGHGGGDANPAYTWGGQNYYFNATSASALGDNHQTTDTVQYAYDADEGNLWFGRNGIWYDSNFKGNGNPQDGINPTVANIDTSRTWIPCGSFYSNSVKYNFGQKPWRFAPPNGFGPITSASSRGDIVKAENFVGVVTYMGSGSARTLSLPFEADLIWSKTRSNAVDHKIVDSVRGLTKVQEANQARVDSTVTTGITATNSHSFSVGTSGDFNTDGREYVTWCWKAGGSKGTFNVDGVGYANASDVNMNAGALNSVAYDNSIVWSNNYSGTNDPGPGFDGTGPKVNGYAHQAGGLTINFPSPGLSGHILVYGGSGGGGADTYTLSDGSSQSSGAAYDGHPYWIEMDFGVKQNITSLVCSPGYTFYGIKVDGKLLVDSDVSLTNAPSVSATGCSVGTKQGFSIVEFTTPSSSTEFSYAHGLTKAPEFIITKSTDNTYSWSVYHKYVGPDQYLVLNTAADDANGMIWNNESPTQHIVRGKSDNFGTSADYITYNWHSVPGLQKFGAYTGNGSDDGQFIELGFKPAIVWIKSNSTSGQEWVVYDNKRGTINPVETFSYINTSDEDQSGRAVDLLANGFKFRLGNSGATNYDDRTYIYCAWAEDPGSGMFGSQSTAR